MLMHTHTISFNYPPITNDCLYPAPQYILWNCCVYPRGRDVRLRNTLPCTVYEVLEYMSVLHETFVTRLTHYPVCPLPGSSGTRHVRITHPARQPGTSGFRYAPSSKRPCTMENNNTTKQATPTFDDFRRLVERDENLLRETKSGGSAGGKSNFRCLFEKLRSASKI